MSTPTNPLPTPRRNVAVILAAGNGRRMAASGPDSAGGGLPKQFVEINGRMVLEYAVEAFEQNARIAEIGIVARGDTMSLVREVVARNGWVKVGRVLEGGDERVDSVRAALCAYAGEGDVNLLLHDAARPGVTCRVIDEVCLALETHEAVCPALPMTDTVICSDDGLLMTGQADRATLLRAQTPQGFRLGVLASAHQAWAQMADGACPLPPPTDDCGLVARTGKARVWIVEGSPRNLKLTYPEDLRYLASFLHK